MKYITAFLFFVGLSLLAICPVYAQLQIDSVVIETRNIPTRFHTVSGIQGGHDRDKVTSEWYGVMSENRKLTNLTVTTVGDTIQLKSNGVWDISPFFGQMPTTQTLNIVFNKDNKKIVSIDYVELGVNKSMLGYELSLSNSEYFFNGNSTIITLHGTELVNKNLNRTQYSNNPAGGVNTSEGQYSTGNISDTETVTIILFGSQPLNVKDKTTTNFNCFPNPTSSTLNIPLSDANSSEIMIFDPLGRCVLTQKTFERIGLISIDITSLPVGIYWVKVDDNMQRFIISR